MNVLGISPSSKMNLNEIYMNSSVAFDNALNKMALRLEGGFVTIIDTQTARCIRKLKVANIDDNETVTGIIFNKLADKIATAGTGVVKNMGSQYGRLY